MARRNTGIKHKYKFTISRYIVEVENAGRWGYESQAQKLGTAKNIVKRLKEKSKNNFQVYDNVMGKVVYIPE